MLQRYFLFLILVISFAGCASIRTAFHKTQTQNVTSMVVSGQENPSSSETEKVWVEAETRKVWVNDHVDENGDMVEGHYKHMIVTPGHWAANEGGKK